MQFDWLEYGDNVTRTLDSNGTLTISGKEEMRHCDYDWLLDWCNYPIKNVIVENSVTEIGG